MNIVPMWNKEEKQISDFKSLKQHNNSGSSNDYIKIITYGVSVMSDE